MKLGMVNYKSTQSDLSDRHVSSLDGDFLSKKVHHITKNSVSKCFRFNCNSSHTLDTTMHEAKRYELRYQHEFNLHTQ